MLLPSFNLARAALLVTMGNLMCGFIALICITQGRFTEASILVLLAAVCDSLDGRIARRGNVVSDMGKEMDSLCDMVSFGAVPALLVYVQFFYQHMSLAAMLAALFYVVCGAYRLARFNISHHTDYFVGIPITLAGIITALLSWVGNGLPGGVMIGVLLLLGCLMVSTIKVPKPLQRSLPEEEISL
ncbi:MAG TPA: CDP-diacylglycerol--serine O-phosphatidyltransferase [Syntrophomonadaceae bacterium]|nr:CDP-diacylglycerol--serine O-phosphatidyltransferase [Syntrophomonadaceae bacterium]HQA08005.1 CDP-diacylglycerol--serine O-phosphatidyltransferase [Syntrophomonadaceae bacterium]HQE23217.1 CDP-diacylglycerol--serine O-phosphatidyltransferase [Syntrophomonadaceae bacterium]